MKTITFFNEKGGVGKSTISIIYASWLKYKHGIKVGVADFNYRLEMFRKNELDLMRENMSEETINEKLEKAWPLVTYSKKDEAHFRKNGALMPASKWLETQMKKGQLKDLDVIICDFPGSYENGYNECMAMKDLGLVVIPIYKEKMSILCAMNTDALNSRYQQNTCAFINKAQANLKSMANKYLRFAKMLKNEAELNLLPDIVLHSNRLDEIEKLDEIKNSFIYPDFNDTKFAPTYDFGLENLFIDVTKELDKCIDIPETEKTDLSCVNGLSKNGNGMQYKGSSFPEYEI